MFILRSLILSLAQNGQSPEERLQPRRLEGGGIDSVKWSRVLEQLPGLPSRPGRESGEALTR